MPSALSNDDRLQIKIKSSRNAVNPIAGDKRKRIPGVILFPSLEGQMVPVSTLRLVALPTSTVCIYVYIYIKRAFPLPPLSPFARPTSATKMALSLRGPLQSTTHHTAPKQPPGPGQWCGPGGTHFFPIVLLLVGWLAQTGLERKWKNV